MRSGGVASEHLRIGRPPQTWHDFLAYLLLSLAQINCWDERILLFANDLIRLINGYPQKVPEHWKIFSVGLRTKWDKGCPNSSGSTDFGLRSVSTSHGDLEGSLYLDG